MESKTVKSNRYFFFVDYFDIFFFLIYLNLAVDPFWISTSSSFWLTDRVIETTQNFVLPPLELFITNFNNDTNITTSVPLRLFISPIGLVLNATFGAGVFDGITLNSPVPRDYEITISGFGLQSLILPLTIEPGIVSR
jgi:hypothetical protein